jgi:hypothetical protein
MGLTLVHQPKTAFLCTYLTGSQATVSKLKPIGKIISLYDKAKTIHVRSSAEPCLETLRKYLMSNKTLRTQRLRRYLRTKSSPPSRSKRNKKDTYTKNPNPSEIQCRSRCLLIPKGSTGKNAGSEGLGV